MNQDNATERLLRYMNWFNYALRGTLLLGTSDTEVDILTIPAGNISNLIDQIDRSTIAVPDITGFDQRTLNRLAVCGCIISVQTQYLSVEDGSITDPSNDLNYIRR